MADFDFDRLCTHAATLAYRKCQWPAFARAFRRDVTTFEWRIGSVFDAFKLASRSLPSKGRIPGRVAIADQGADGPKPEVYADFLQRGGTLIVEGGIRLEELGVKVTAKKIPPGKHTVKGPAIDALDPICRSFWVDDDGSLVEVAKAEVLVSIARGAMVSRLAHGGGTVVVFSSEIAGFERKSETKQRTTPAAVAKLMNVAIADDTDPLADTSKFPNDLFVAQLTMFSVLGGVVAEALS